MPEPVTYGQLRTVLTRLGFREQRRATGIGLEHAESNTLFLFRPYHDLDAVKPPEVENVRAVLDARGLLPADAFDGQLTKAPA
ncbi:MAG: hypothetical protein K2R98_34240 [Gemmataceae bacterium]|nr:hypothetical protein [Gemmataceae bacterium]